MNSIGCTKWYNQIKWFLDIVTNLRTKKRTLCNCLIIEANVLTSPIFKSSSKSNRIFFFVNEEVLEKLMT